MIQNLGCGESTGAAPVKLFPTAIQVGSSGATTSGATSQLGTPASKLSRSPPTGAEVPGPWVPRT